MASLLKRANTYYVQYKLNGRFCRVSCKTSVKKIAQEVLRQYQQVEASGYNHLPSRQKVSLGEFIPEHLHLSKVKISADWLHEKEIMFNASIKPFFGEETPLQEITLEKVQNFRSARARTVSSRTINKEVNCLLTLMRHAVERGKLRPEFVPRIKILKAPSSRLRFLTQAEVKILLETAEKFSPGMEAFVRLMLYAGLRLMEALTLRWKDTDLIKGLIVIAPQEGWAPKSRKTRIVPIPTDLLTYLTKRREQQTKSDLVVVSPDDYTVRNLQRYLKAVIREAGLPTEGEDKVTAHTLRHTYASHLVMNGTPLYTVSALLGHSDAKTTQIYAHLAPDYLKEAVRGIKYCIDKNHE